MRTRHSEKPEEVRRRIEALFGDVRRIVATLNLAAAVIPSGIYK